MHQAAIRSLGLVEDRLRKRSPERKATYYKDKRKESIKYQSPQSQTSDSTDDEKHRARREDARNIIAQTRVNNARYASKEENYEDDKKEMGALCFTRRVRRTRVPKGFKLPHDQQKYDGSHEPKLWLSDYLQAVQILRGTRATAMQSLQLHLTGAARSWLSILPNDSIGSGENWRVNLQEIFVQHTNGQRRYKKSSPAYRGRTKLYVHTYSGGV
jgi:hypothetical protein